MIKVNFTDGVEVMTSSTHLYQWDSNQEITISGLNIANASVHFTNKKRNDAIVVNGTRNNNSLVADIPNILLEDDLDIIAYVHVVASNKGNTIKVVKIPKVARQKPSDYQFTQNIEIMNFERLQSDFNDLADECHEVLDQIQRELITVDGEGAVSDGGYSIIKPRRATFSEWVNANTVLAEGEIAVEVPTDGVGTGISKIKIGDGTTSWNDLPYAVDDVQGAIDELKGTIGYSKKNLLKVALITKTQNNVEFTVNSDKSITISGTPNSNNSILIGTVTLKKGEYIISGLANGSGNTYFMYISSPYVQVENSEKTLTLTEEKTVDLLFRYNNGVAINTTIYPMIRYASIEDDTYEPYVNDVQTQLDSKISNNLFTSWASLPTAPGMLLNGTTYEIGFAVNRVFLMTIFNEYNQSSIYTVETGNMATKCTLKLLKGSAEYFEVTPLTKTTLSIKPIGGNGYATYMCIGGA